MEDEVINTEIDQFFSQTSEDGDSQEQTTDDVQEVETDEETTEDQEEEIEEEIEEEAPKRQTPEEKAKMLQNQKKSLEKKLSKKDSEIQRLTELNEKYESWEMTHEELVQREISKYKIEQMQDQEIGKSSEKHWISEDAIKEYVDKWLSVEDATTLAIAKSWDKSKLLDDQTIAKIKWSNGIVGWPANPKAKIQSFEDLAKEIDRELWY